jgi:hypothetical protein
MLADQFLDLLVRACPRFAPIWAKEDDVKPDFILAIPELTRLLGALHRNGETTCFPAVFATIDRALDEGDDQTQTLVHELVDDLCSGNGTRLDPTYFEPYLGPVAAEQWRALQRSIRAPDPRSPGVLALLIEHNPAQLTGDLRLEYRVASSHLPGFLDLADSFELFRRALWRYVQEHLPKDLDVPEDHYNEVARILWDEWEGNTRTAQQD